MQELENTNHRLEGEVRRLSESNAASQSSQEALSSRLEEQERLGKAASRKHDEEVGHLGIPIPCMRHQGQQHLTQSAI